jgi:hypothetical protein
MKAVELRIEIKGDVPQSLVIGSGFGGENFEDHQPVCVMKPINSHLLTVRRRSDGEEESEQSAGGG